jgi:F0F1-type ATP synthase delta subunit
MAGSSLTLARPYARAAFEAAREAGTLVEWGEALAFAAAAARVPEAASAIGGCGRWSGYWFRVNGSSIR